MGLLFFSSEAISQSVSAIEIGNNLCRATSLSIDEVGNTYIGGTYQDSAQIFNQSFYSDSTNCFIACLDTNKNVKWIKTFGGPYYSLLYDMSYSNGYLYACGTFNN